MRALCERWLAQRAEEVGTPSGIREVTVRGHESAPDAPLRHTGDRIAARDHPRPDRDGAPHARHGRRQVRPRPLSHRSIVKALTALRQAFDYAVREEWLRVNPATLAKPARPQPLRRPSGGRQVSLL